MPVSFKLLKHDGRTRRVIFQSLPTWEALSSKLHSLYDIPVNQIGVSYLDNDNDEITLSSDEELRDFYQSSYEDGQTIKFSVFDLNATPREGKSPVHPLASNRSALGQDNFEFIEHWHPLTALTGIPGLAFPEEANSNFPHAFVEVVSNGDLAAATNLKDPDNSLGSDADDDASTVHPTFIDKGKAKASSFDAASITSVVDEEPSYKYPIHVYDVNSNKIDEESQKAVRDDVQSFQSPDTDIAAHSTPKPNVQDLRKEKVGEKHPVESLAEDPPLPSFDPLPASQGSATLSHDVASLLTTFSNVIASHPELSEGVRNIARNATNGIYWQAHRSALSRAVNEYSQGVRPTGEEPNPEVEAARRVSDALGGIFRAFTQLSSPSQTADSGVPSQPVEPQQVQPVPQKAPSYESQHSWAQQYMTGPDASHVPPPPSTQATPGPPLAVLHPPPNRPLPRIVPQHGPPPAPSGTVQSDAQPPSVQNPSTSRPLSRGFPNIYVPETAHNSQEPTTSSFTQPTSEQPGPSPQRSNPQDLRAQVEAAKLLYKAEKERYRRERELRRKEREERGKPDVRNQTLTGHAAATVLESRAQPPSPVVRNALDRYPQELYNVPRRHNTHLGHASSSQQHNKKPEDITARAQARISRRLSDMGFTENTYPDLPAKIKDHLSQSRTITKEVEDDVVTTLLEKLLAASPRPGGNRDASGTWQL